MVELLCDCELMWLLLIEGKLDAASNIALRSLASCTTAEKESSWAVGLLYVGMARLCLQWLETDKAHTYIEQAQGLLSASSNVDAYIEGRITSARCYRADGDSESAYEILLDCYELMQLEHIPRGVDLLTLVTLADALEARGDFQRATSILDEAEGRMESSDYFYWLHVEIARARLEGRKGRVPEACEILEEALALAQETGFSSWSLIARSISRRR